MSIHAPRINRCVHYVYRCYDAADRLLYVGCTGNLRERMRRHTQSEARHAASRYLARHMARYEVTQYLTKAAGRAAEAEAIWNEAPLLNQGNNQGRGLTSEEVDALLANETETAA